MASLGALSLPGFKRLSVSLEDCMKAPADLRAAAQQEPEGERLLPPARGSYNMCSLPAAARDTYRCLV